MSMPQTGKLQLSSTNAAVVTGGDTSTFTQVTFPSPFPANAAVIVIPSVQTFNGPETPGLRIADVTTTGFKMRPRDRLSPHQSCDSGPGKGHGDLSPTAPHPSSALRTCGASGVAGAGRSSWRHPTCS